MRRLRVLVYRIASLFGENRRDRELADEIESNLQFHIADNLRAGMTAEEARRQALIRLGGIEQAKEGIRDQRGLPIAERVGKDLHYALRMFRKSPGFTLFAGAALALGIAATTAIFSIADAVLLRPFPYRNPSRLVTVWEDDTAYGFPRNNGSPFAFTEWRQRNHVFEDMAALTYDSLNLTGHGAPEYLHADTVTPNFFSVLGVNAVEGRTFTADDGRPGAPLTTVLSFGLWTRQFAADPKIVGRDVLLNGAKYTVIGVMPRRFLFLDSEIDLWVPAQWTSELIERRKTDRFLTIVARLKPGIGVDRANSEMADLGKQLSAEHVWDGNAVAVPLREQVSGDVRPAVLLLLGAVGFLLLIACANIANLLLARASTRTREMALRVALGASRRRVMEQVLVESVLLSCVAGAAGLALAMWATRFVTTLIPPGIADGVQVDGSVLAFAAAASIATGILFGILPAWRASQVNLVGSLKQGGAQSGIGAAGHRVRDVLVIAEVSLAVVLLAGAALMVRSFEKLYHQDPGFRAEHVLTLQTALPRPKYDDFGRRRAFYREVVQRVESLPGVAAAGYATDLPLANAGGGSLVTVENKPVDPKHMLIANVRVVTPDYFRAVGMTLRQGRLLADSDGADAPKVVVINQTLADNYWPGKNPIGRRFKRGLLETNSPWWTVVGVVADMRQGGMAVPVRPEAYFSTEQADFFAPDSLAVRTVGDPAGVASEVRKQIWAVDPDQPVASVMPMTELVDASVAPSRTNTLLLAGFGFMGLLLSALGIYGVLAFAVTQSTREIGVRVALGARPGDILGDIVGSGLRLFAIGLAIGLAASIALSRLLSHMLFEIKPGDPWSYAAMIIVLGTVTLLACYIPARRATKVEPMVALRYE
jgi:putative ABC transport system permease protein